MKALLKSFWAEESGQTLAEYALLLGLITVVSIVILTTLGTRIQSVFNKVDVELQNID